MTYDIQYINKGNWVTVIGNFSTKEKAQKTLPLINDVLFNANPESPLVMRIFESVDDQTEELAEASHKRITVL